MISRRKIDGQQIMVACLNSDGIIKAKHKRSNNSNNNNTFEFCLHHQLLANKINISG